MYVSDSVWRNSESELENSGCHSSRLVVIGLLVWLFFLGFFLGFFMDATEVEQRVDIEIADTGVHQQHQPQDEAITDSGNVYVNGEDEDEAEQEAEQ
jgi:hypothetical protein